VWLGLGADSRWVAVADSITTAMNTTTDFMKVRTFSPISSTRFGASELCIGIATQKVTKPDAGASWHARFRDG
jgi:hypothetical protein